MFKLKGSTMPSQHGKPPGVSLGEKSKTEEKRFGHAVHSSGTHTEAEHAEAEKAAAGVKRPAHKAPTSLPKKGGQ
jgi:hypothetical protein